MNSNFMFTQRSLESHTSESGTRYSSHNRALEERHSTRIKTIPIPSMDAVERLIRQADEVKKQGPYSTNPTYPSTKVDIFWSEEYDV